MKGLERTKIAVSDDLPGIEEAVGLVFSGADHTALLLARGKERQDQGEAVRLRRGPFPLKAIHRAPGQKETEIVLAPFEEYLKKRHPHLVRYWRENPTSLLSFLSSPKQLRLYIYTTNQLERPKTR